MEPSTQKKILDARERLCAEIGSALGFKNATYEEVFRFVRASLPGPTGQALPPLLLVWAKSIVPDGADVTIDPKRFDEYLALVDTLPKAEAVLGRMPEPDPKWLDLALVVVKSYLPQLRHTLLPMAKRLPHPPGGRPKKLSDPTKREEIRKEIRHLVEQGVSLQHARARIAQREGVGERTIERIWQNKSLT